MIHHSPYSLASNSVSPYLSFTPGIDGHLPVVANLGNSSGLLTSLPADFAPPASTLPTSTMNLSGSAIATHSFGTSVPVTVGNQLTAKHICAICSDRASGKHYGVYSCEGCKGFFKRTVRKELVYTCRDEQRCLIDKRQRNRCQYCRYQKCLSTGMKREAVQEERQRKGDKDGTDASLESPSSSVSDMPIDAILEAELAAEPEAATLEPGVVDLRNCADPLRFACQIADQQLVLLIRWAKFIPHYTDLSMEDQVALLRAAWTDLLVASITYRSTTVENGLLLGPALLLHRTTADAAGILTLFDRMVQELIDRMRDLQIDRAEIGCLRAILLFNPEVIELKAVDRVEQLRDKLYTTLGDYCRAKCAQDCGRFAKLLLRLPAIRSIGLKCTEHLVVFRRALALPADTLLLKFLDENFGASAAPAVRAPLHGLAGAIASVDARKSVGDDYDDPVTNATASPMSSGGDTCGAAGAPPPAASLSLGLFRNAPFSR